MEFLFEPIDASRAHDIDFLISWHGRLMVIAWSVLFPVGILAARFFKITPRQKWPEVIDNIVWWRTHLSTQYLGGAFVVIAFIMIWQSSTGRPEADYHRIGGYSVLAICFTQFLAGWLRGSKGGPTDPGPNGSLSGDHFDMTFKRKVFEYYHKITGYLLLLMSIATTATGMWVANAPVWMWASLTVWWSLLIIAFSIFQSKGMAVDTYQAIWGPDKSLPGNKIKPIGWRVRRR